MTQQEILEYNKRCALFLGWKNKGMVNLEIWCSTNNQIGIATSQLQFHSDWNLIMEVVEAIEKLGYNCKIHKKSCYIKEDNIFIAVANIDSFKLQTKKEAVVKAINQFLNWYNNNETNI